jgi:hypothetical protein
MGHQWLFECDGCGASTGPIGLFSRFPEGWRVFTATPSPSLMPPRPEVEPTVVCGECWRTKTLAEVLTL